MLKSCFQHVGTHHMAERSKDSTTPPYHHTTNPPTFIPPYHHTTSVPWWHGGKVAWGHGARGAKGRKEQGPRQRGQRVQGPRSKAQGPRSKFFCFRGQGLRLLTPTHLACDCTLCPLRMRGKCIYPSFSWRTDLADHENEGEMQLPPHSQGIQMSRAPCRP